jgi:peptidoglycan/LPS O-acetylase OafA/YrhL
MERMPQNTRLMDQEYIPGLYGWKLIAIYLLIADHLYLASGVIRPVYAVPLTDGLTGVFAFFIISGYLVTRTAIKEGGESGTIDLRRFFVRRALRVIPAYYVFLLTLGLFSSVSRVPFSSLAAGLTFTVNYVSVPRHIIININHIWACCVEEHFYLLWIPLLAACGKKRAWPFIVALIIIPTVLRCEALPPQPTWYNINRWWADYSLSYLHFPSVALGAGLALLEGHDRFERIVAWARKRYAHIGAVVFMIFLSPWLADR